MMSKDSVSLGFENVGLTASVAEEEVRVVSTDRQQNLTRRSSGHRTLRGVFAHACGIVPQKHRCVFGAAEHGR